MFLESWSSRLFLLTCTTVPTGARCPQFRGIRLSLLSCAFAFQSSLWQFDLYVFVACTSSYFMASSICTRAATTWLPSAHVATLHDHVVAVLRRSRFMVRGVGEHYGNICVRVSLAMGQYVSPPAGRLHLCRGACTTGLWDGNRRWPALAQTLAACLREKGSVDIWITTALGHVNSFIYWRKLFSKSSQA